MRSPLVEDRVHGVSRFLRDSSVPGRVPAQERLAYWVGGVGVERVRVGTLGRGTGGAYEGAGAAAETVILAEKFAGLVSLQYFRHRPGIQAGGQQAGGQLGRGWRGRCPGGGRPGGLLPFGQGVLRRSEYSGGYDVEDPARVDVPGVPVVRNLPVVAERGHEQESAAVPIAGNLGVPRWLGAVSRRPG